MTAPISSRPASFDHTEPAVGPAGQLAHPLAVEHLDRLAPKVYRVGEATWCVVGNGLSNQTFVKGPEGLIAIDTGDSNEEMNAAIDLLREETDTPIVACIYSHFHYVDGTQAIVDAEGLDPAALPIWGHERIVANRQRFGGEVAGRSRRGLVHQFGIALPAEGPDALLHVGLGRFFSNPEHRPASRGHLPVTTPIAERLATTIAGLQVELTHAPSDSDDSLTIWFPDLGVCVNNLLWPALFNVFAIRGEEYRDPRILLTGLDHLQTLGAEHLVGTHGPPLSGAESIAAEVANYRDAIQFLWDQTVRGANNGLTCDELTVAVQLPDQFRQSTLTRQIYGLVEHHVRQIHAGLFGWFDEDPSHLFPLERADRANRMIEGFGGRSNVLARCDEAIDAADWRWAIELAGWLAVTPPGDDDTGRHRLATALRGIAHHTTSQNVRNWCLTKALELDGTIDTARFYGLRLRPAEIAAMDPATSVALLRVLLDPERADGQDQHLRIRFDDETTCGLHVRRSVAVPTDGSEADLGITIDRATWAQIIGGRLSLSDALSDGRIEIDQGEADQVRSFFAQFDLETLAG